jgi:hypothetical protein
MLTREMLLGKKAELEAERDRLVNNLNAIGGALQLCEVLLAELEKEQPLENHAEEKAG